MAANLDQENQRELKNLLDFLEKYKFGPQQRFDLAKKLGISLVQSTKLRFADSVDPQGKAWLPLKQFRNRKRDKAGKRRDQNPKPLIDTGRLRSSITYSASSNYVDVGTNVVYAATHNYGRGRIPQRQFLGISAKDETTIYNTVEKQVESFKVGFK